MKLPIYSTLVLLLARVLRLLRIIGESDYEHLKFHLWLEADTKARGVRFTNVTPRGGQRESSQRGIVGQLEELQQEASR